MIHERGITGRALSTLTNRVPRRLRIVRGSLRAPDLARGPPRRGGRGNFVASSQRSRRLSEIEQLIDVETFPVDSRRDCVVAFFPNVSVSIESIHRASFIHEQRKQRDDLTQLDFDC